MATEQQIVVGESVEDGLKFCRVVKNKRGVVLYTKEKLIRCIFQNEAGNFQHHSRHTFVFVLHGYFMLGKRQELAVSEKFAVEENFVSQDEVVGLHQAYLDDYLADFEATIARSQKNTDSM